MDQHYHVFWIVFAPKDRHSLLDLPIAKIAAELKHSNGWGLLVIMSDRGRNFLLEPVSVGNGATVGQHKFPLKNNTAEEKLISTWMVDFRILIRHRRRTQRQGKACTTWEKSWRNFEELHQRDVYIRLQRYLYSTTN